MSDRGKMDYATPQRFIAACRRVGVTDARASSVWQVLRDRYSERHRHYHNLSHIEKMLYWFDSSPSTDEATELAIWFHDIVYDPLDSHNEAQSARLFESCLGAEVGRTLSETVARLIVATDPTRARTGEPDEDLLIDIDLSILGSPPDDYDAYRMAIRREYSHVPDPDFAAGRKTILQAFLSRRIYATDFLGHLEEPARINLRAELELLDSTGKQAERTV